MWKTFISACLLAGMTTAAAAQNGGTALPFTRIERNPRAAALAGAGAASLHNASAWSAFGGSALLPFMDGKVDAALGVQLWEPSNTVDKATHFQGGAGLHFGNFGVAIGGAYQMGTPSGNFRPSDQVVSLGFSYGIGKRLSLGINGRWAGQQLAPGVRFNGFSMDVAVLGRITPELSATLGVNTLGTLITDSNGQPFGQPSCAYAGVAWDKAIGSDHRVELMLDGDYNFDGSFGGAFGAEYAFRQMLSVRAGYRLAARNTVIPSHLALGVGFHFAGFRLDVSWFTASALLKNTLNLGIGYRF